MNNADTPQRQQLKQLLRSLESARAATRNQLPCAGTFPGAYSSQTGGVTSVNSVPLPHQQQQFQCWLPPAQQQQPQQQVFPPAVVSYVQQPFNQLQFLATPTAPLPALPPSHNLLFAIPNEPEPQLLKVNSFLPTAEKPLTSVVAPNSSVVQTEAPLYSKSISNSLYSVPSSLPSLQNIQSLYSSSPSPISSPDESEKPDSHFSCPDDAIDLTHESKSHTEADVFEKSELEIPQQQLRKKEEKKKEEEADIPPPEKRQRRTWVEGRGPLGATAVEETLTLKTEDDDGQPSTPKRYLVVHHIDEGGPLQLAGTKRGDILLSWNGRHLHCAADLKIALSRHIGGDTACLRVRRGDVDTLMEVKPQINLVDAVGKAAVPVSQSVQTPLQIISSSSTVRISSAGFRFQQREVVQLVAIAPGFTSGLHLLRIRLRKISFSGSFRYGVIPTALGTKTFVPDELIKLAGDGWFVRDDNVCLSPQGEQISTTDLSFASGFSVFFCIDCEKGIIWLSKDGDSFFTIENFKFTVGSQMIPSIIVSDPVEFEIDVWEIKDGVVHQLSFSQPAPTDIVGFSSLTPSFKKKSNSNEEILKQGGEQSQSSQKFQHSPSSSSSSAFDTERNSIARQKNAIESKVLKRDFQTFAAKNSVVGRSGNRSTRTPLHRQQKNWTQEHHRATHALPPIQQKERLELKRYAASSSHFQSSLNSRFEENLQKMEERKKQAKQQSVNMVAEIVDDSEKNINSAALFQKVSSFSSSSSSSGSCIAAGIVDVASNELWESVMRSSSSLPSSS